MSAADNLSHPWPLDGWIELRFRRATWCIVRPWYGYHNIFIPLTAVKWMTPIHFLFPFFTLKTKYFHWYAGWKPITLKDPGFYWRDLDQVLKWRAEDRQFVQLSWRWGVGEIS